MPVSESVEEMFYKIEQCNKNESPIEAQFALALASELTPYRLTFDAQYQCGPYRLDFAIPVLSIAIEIDGKAFHTTPKQRQHDAKKDTYLRNNGWRVFRFTGSEVYKDAVGCAHAIGCCIMNLESL